MTDVRPTPARLALLRSIASGNVYRSIDNGRCYLDGRREVTAKMRDLAHAGWVALARVPEGERRRFHDHVQWELTDAGRALLAEP